MSRKVDPKTVKVGDRVRVSRAQYPIEHGIKFGAICVVVSGPDDFGDFQVEGPRIDEDEWTTKQWVSAKQCKVAK